MRWKNINITILLMGNLLFSKYCFAQNEKFACGKIQNLDDCSPIESVYVTNLRSQKKISSNHKGSFCIKAIDGDTLEFFTNGYEPKKVEWLQSKNDQIYFLSKSAIALNPVEVIAEDISVSQQVNNSFLKNTPTPNEIRLKLKKESKVILPGAIIIYLDPLYELLSKEGKAKRKLLGLQRAEAFNQLAKLRYNESIIEELTGFSGIELKNFMNFCALSDEYVHHVSDYELFKEVLFCEVAFMKK